MQSAVSTSMQEAYVSIDSEAYQTALDKYNGLWDKDI
mgnify:CR=1 FL=1